MSRNEDLAFGALAPPQMSKKRQACDNNAWVVCSLLLWTDFQELKCSIQVKWSTTLKVSLWYTMWHMAKNKIILNKTVGRWRITPSYVRVHLCQLTMKMEDLSLKCEDMVVKCEECKDYLLCSETQMYDRKYHLADSWDSSLIPLCWYMLKCLHHQMKI